MNNLICQLIISHKKSKNQKPKINTQKINSPLTPPLKKSVRFTTHKKISEIRGIRVSPKTTSTLPPNNSVRFNTHKKNQ